MENLREHHSNSAHHIMKAMFSTTIMWLRDTGILNKLKFDVMNPPIPIPDPKLRHKQPLILRQLGIIMIILVVGLNIALVVFLCEVWISRKNICPWTPCFRVGVVHRNHFAHTLAATPPFRRQHQVTRSESALFQTSSF